MATIAAAVISAGAAYYASRQAGKRSKQERAAADALGRNSETAGRYGEDMLGMSKEALGPVYDYYMQLAGGDRESLMRYLSPEILAQTQGSRRAFQTGSELAPRSGMGTESVSRIPAENSAAIARLISGAHPAGVQGLATLGTNWGSLGLSGLGQGSGAAGQVLGYEQNRRADQRAAGEAAGSSAYEIFKLFQGAGGGGGANARGGGGGSGGSTYNPDYMNFWKNQ